LPSLPCLSVLALLWLGLTRTMSAWRWCAALFSEWDQPLGVGPGADSQQPSLLDVAG
jgi:hypothetical protein